MTINYSAVQGEIEFKGKQYKYIAKKEKVNNNGIYRLFTIYKIITGYTDKQPEYEYLLTVKYEDGSTYMLDKIQEWAINDIYYWAKELLIVEIL
jgi:ABC-type branched-subunit amino acid transport system ATPase component